MVLGWVEPPRAKDRPSMMLEWSRSRSSRDALRLEVWTWDRDGQGISCCSWYREFFWGMAPPVAPLDSS